MPATEMQYLATPQSTMSLAMLLVGLFVGLFVWVSGRRLAKPLCLLTGLVVGVVVGLGLRQSLGIGGGPYPAAAVGGLGGLALAWLLFRICMALSLAFVLVVTLPLVALTWRGSPLPNLVKVNDDARAAATEPQTEPDMIGVAADVCRRQAHEVHAWWKDLPDGAKVAATAPAATGLAAGVFFGLVTPYFAATLETALLGGAVWFYCTGPLLTLYWPRAAAHYPRGQGPVVLAVSLITLLGVVVQWIISRRRTDK